MSTAQEVTELLRTEEQRLASRYPDGDIRGYRIVTSKALMIAPEGFFTRFDKAVQHGVQAVRTSGATSQQDALKSVQEYVARLNTTDTSKKVVGHFVVNALFGYDILDPLMSEKSVHEIHVTPDGAVSIRVHGAQRPVSSIGFRDAKHISAVINKMLKKASSKKKVSANVIRATLPQHTVVEVTQEDAGFSLNITKTIQKQQPTESTATPAPQRAPESTEPARERPRKQKRRNTSRTKQSASERTTAPPQDEADSQWKVDPKTGKRYKSIPGINASAVRDAKKSGATWMSIEELQQNVAQDPDFDGDDLNKSAEIFMAHLRVAPDKKETERLRQEKKERIQKLREEHPEAWGVVPDDA